MFKNSLKIIVLVGMLALSMVPSAASFSMQTPTVLTNHLKKSSLMSSLQFCRTTLRPDLLIRKHPVITLCVGLGFCAYGLAAYGLIRCYSGLSPDKNGKNSNNTDSQKTVFERFKAMTNVNKIKTLFCPLVFMYSFIQPQVWTEFVDALDHVTAHKQIKEKQEEKKEKTTGTTTVEKEPWSKRLYSAVNLLETDANTFKEVWQEKINTETKTADFKKIDKEFREEMQSLQNPHSLLTFAIQNLSFDHVEQLLKLGADASEVIKNEKGKIVKTPLLLALCRQPDSIMSSFDQIKIVAMLLNHGAKEIINTSTDIPEHLKQGPLFFAVTGNGERLTLTKLLVSNGANLNIENVRKNTPLHLAAENNDTSLCQYLFEQGANGNATNIENKKPWQLAGLQSYENWLEALYPKKEDREKAIEKNNKNILKKEVKKEKQKIEELEKKQKLATQIEQALLDDNASQVQALLEKNPWFDPFTRYQDITYWAIPGKTLFELALQNKKTAVLQYLLSAYAKENDLDKLFPSFALKENANLDLTFGQYKEELINLIYKYLPKEETSNEQKAWHKYQERLKYKKIVSKLYEIAAQKTINNQDIQFFTNNLDKHLLSDYSSLIIFDNKPSQETLFYNTIRNNNIELAKILLTTEIENTKVNPNQAVVFNSNKWLWPLPLHWAIKNNNLSMLKLLIKHGANPDLKTINANNQVFYIQSPREYAITLYSKDPFPKPEESNPQKLEQKDTEVESQVIEQEKEKEEISMQKKEVLSWGEELFSTMGYSSEKDKFESLWSEKINNKTTKEQFKDIDKQFRNDLKTSSQYKRYTSLLCETARSLDFTHVMQLLNLGADASEIIKDDFGQVDMTPLFAATQNMTKDGFIIAKTLLEKGAASTINIQLSWDTSTIIGMTALHKAAYTGKLALVELLVKNNAQLDIKDENGDTPLHHAAQSVHDNNQDICRYLLVNGADGNAVNKKGKTPWQVAGGTYNSLDAWIKHLYPKPADLIVALKTIKK